MHKLLLIFVFAVAGWGQYADTSISIGYQMVGWRPAEIIARDLSNTLTRHYVCGFYTSYGQGSKSIRKIILNAYSKSVSGDNDVVWSLRNADTATTYPMRPDDTEDQTATQTLSAITIDGQSNTSTSPALSADRAMTEGEPVCAVVRWGDTPAGDVFALWLTDHAGIAPQWGQYESGAYATVATWKLPVLFEHSDGTIGGLLGGHFPAVQANLEYNSGSSTTEAGLYFEAPIGTKLRHVDLYMSATVNFDVVLYNAAGTALKTVSVLGEDIGQNERWFPVPFGDYALEAGTTYRLAVKPGASNVRLFYYNFHAASHLIAAQHWGVWTQKTSGTWAETDTRLPVIRLHLAGVEQTGGSASSYPIQ